MNTSAIVICSIFSVIGIGVLLVFLFYILFGKTFNTIWWRLLGLAMWIVGAIPLLIYGYLMWCHVLYGTPVDADYIQPPIVPIVPILIP